MDYGFCSRTQAAANLLLDVVLRVVCETDLKDSRDYE